MTPTRATTPTLRQLVDDAVERLQRAGIIDIEGRRDAVLLARWLLGWDAARWLTDGRQTASPDFIEAFTHAITRRLAREPVAYITGEREFYGRPFAVSPAVLIPRPETELVVEAARDVVTVMPPEWDPPVIVDAGTGSGCLAVTLALEHPHARVIATDRSRAALEVAQANAARHGLEIGIEWVETDWLHGLRTRPHLVVSNPPYVPERDRPALAPEVTEYEPSTALFAGDDGLAAMRRLFPAAAAALAPGGTLIVEIGAGQADAVTALATASGLVVDRVLPDLQSHPRVVVAHVPVLPHHRR